MQLRPHCQLLYALAECDKVNLGPNVEYLSPTQLDTFRVRCGSKTATPHAPPTYATAEELSDIPTVNDYIIGANTTTTTATEYGTVEQMRDGSSL